MNWNLVIGTIIFTLIITALGGGAAYFVWIKTRQKKETWIAKIYQLSEGVTLKNNLKLHDMKPYAEDVLEKIEKEPGITVYRLQKANRPTQEVHSNHVEYWGKGKSVVSVLYHKGSYTLLTKGYDADTGEVVFDPMPLSRINMMKSEMAIRKDRLVKEKDILQAITPWIIGGITLMTLVGLFYIGVQGMVEISENLKEAFEMADEKIPSPQAHEQSLPQEIKSLGSQPPNLEG